jgi:hypothetical protein
MTGRRFFTQLLLLTALTGGILFFLQIFPVFHPGKWLGIAGLAFFALLSLSMYHFAAKAAVSKDKNAFTRLIMVFTFVKLLLSVSIVVVYSKTIQPEGKFFILPFFLVYLIYTIFETGFMTKLGKIKAR